MFILDVHGKAPLHWSTEKGYVEAAEVLLEYGADVNLQDVRGESSLSTAAMDGSRRLTELLL